MFRLMGDMLVPDMITREFGLVPTFSCRKGEEYLSRAGQLRRPTGIWAIGSECSVLSTSLEVHIQYLLERLEPRSDVIDRVRMECALDGDLHCVWVSATGHGGPVLSPALLGRIAQLSLVLDFDYYGPYDD
jgi:hypothetical protein